MNKLSLSLLFYLGFSIIITEVILCFNQILSNNLLKFSISITYNDLFITICIYILLSIIPVIFFYMWLILIIIKRILYFHQIFINKNIQIMNYLYHVYHIINYLLYFILDFIY